MSSNRNSRNFGNGKTLNSFTIRNLSRETARIANRGDALALKSQSALRDFATHLKETYGIKYLERVESQHLTSWANSLHERLVGGTISTSTTSSYVSAINTVFKTHDRSELKFSANDFGIQRGTKFSNLNLENSYRSQQEFKNYLEMKYQETKDLRYCALTHTVTIQSEAGLRFRESTQIKIGSKDLEGRTLSLVKGDGVKNNQPRTFIPSRMDGLKAARQFVNEHNGHFSKGSLIPHSMTYREYKTWAYRTLSEFRQISPNNAAYHYHGNRHYFSHQEYEKAWRNHTGVSIKAPVVSNIHGQEHITRIAVQINLDIKVAANLDREINLEVAEKLGHHRVESGYSYNGK